jgi:hypothetical protein
MQTSEIEIAEINESADGWVVTYWNVNREEWTDFEIDYYKFIEWMAEKLFADLPGSKQKAIDYILAEPVWTKDYQKEYFLSCLKRPR